jgi:selenocysteine-specific elongation factor
VKHVIAGTAGHIDHGKTALVRALTGIDTDRLEEEKRRGISIDLGFAHLDLAPDLRVAVIDVPGHERFIKNMLAGVGGIDFVVLVVAADESVKTQTREHFEICRLLRIRAGVVALTKADLVDEDTLGVTRLEVEDFVRDSFLEGAAVVPVSAVTGQGLTELRAEIERLARAATARDSSQLLRIPIDRSFVMQGFGAVVTGTVFAGSVCPEDAVQIYPTERVVRVRSVQVHGRPAKRASAGQRAALNLAGASHDELQRGMVLGPERVLAAGTVFDCVLELLAAAKPLKNRAPVHFHAGAAEIPAEVRTLDNSPLVEPGSSAMVRIVLREPMLLLPGDRFIVRMFSPVVTIGGGEVIDNDPPRRMRRDALVARTKALSSASLEERIALLVAEAPDGLSLGVIVARTGHRPTTLPSSVERTGDWLLDKSAKEQKLAGLRTVLADFHRANPLLPGCSKEELRTRVMPAVPVQVFETLLAADKQVVATAEHVRLVSHTLALQSDEREATAKIEAAFEGAGLAVPSVPEVLKASGVDVGRAKSLLQLLLRDKRLTRVSEDLVFHHRAIEGLRSQLATRKGQRFSVAEFKDWTGVSRKYAIPLLEWLDRERVTRRDGDARLVV